MRPGPGWLWPVTFSLPRRDPIDDPIDGEHGIEMVASRAWPALEQLPLGPWVLRANGGFSRRANSVLAAGAVGDVEALDLIERAEKLYAERGLPAQFQLATSERHRRLHEVLLERGYQVGTAGEVSVLVAALRVLRSVAPADRDGRVRIADLASDAWIERWWAAQHAPAVQKETAIRFVGQLAGRCGFAAHVNGAAVLAAGLGVIEGAWLGLFSIGSEPDESGRGSDRRIVGALATWGIAHAAQRAYVQIGDTNPARLELFRSFGFTPLHRYRFLERPQP